MKLTFYGACQKVTGSCYLLEHGRTRLLIDCGMVQGSRFAERDNQQPFEFDPASVQAVLITHAHIDHTGRLPKLVHDGFSGHVYATAATLDFAALLLEDSAHVLRQESEMTGGPLLYTEEDVMNLTKLFAPVEYETSQVIGDFTVTFYDAGHILGSAFIKVTATSGESIIFSGDVGNPPVPLLRHTSPLPAVDYLVMESTYGNREHEPTKERKLLLASAIYETVTMGGVLLIPAFAIERTQEILYELNSLVEHHDIPAIPIFIDSPLAIKATRLYRTYKNLLNTETSYLMANGDDVFRFPGLQLCESRDQSKGINHIKAPKIIMAGSGMMQGGRIRHHLKLYLGDFRNQVLIVGYQVAGSLGRQLLEGEKKVMIDDEQFTVKAKIRALGGYSAHADQAKLLNWLGTAPQPPKQIWLTHGELDQATGLKATLEQRHYQTTIPEAGQTISFPV